MIVLVLCTVALVVVPQFFLRIRAKLPALVLDKQTSETLLLSLLGTTFDLSRDRSWIYADPIGVAISA